MGELLRKFREQDESGLGLRGDYRDPESFYEVAEPLLRAVREEVYKEILPDLEQYPGVWHPLGFMAWKFGRLESLGVLRLDVWPEGERKQSPRGPKIHDHTWHLSSLVVDGTYVDEIYMLGSTEEVVEDEEERKRRDLLRVFRPDGSRLTTDGTCVSITKVEDRRIETGSIHTIDTGVFHTTTVPLGRLAATLVLESPTIHTSPRILMDTPIDPMGGPKIAITMEEAIAAKEQLL